jgi:ubiquinone/menaquinone biosynthesis C-methylase UbiE
MPWRRLLIVVLGMAAATLTVGAQHGRPFKPEDLGLLEAPDRDVWQRPEDIMDALGIGDGTVVADLGAGGGWFTIRLSPRVGPNGIVYAEDFQPQMIKVIERRIALEGLKNIRPTRGTADDPHLPAGQLDAALMVDAFYEVQKPSVFLRNLAVSLKPNGRLGIVEFTKDGGGPGPPMDVRVDPVDVIRDAEAAGLRLLKRETFLRYQYMLVFGKRQP